jgi:hypothetical protein
LQNSAQPASEARLELAGPMFRYTMPFSVGVFWMFYLVTLRMFWGLMRKILGRERRLGRELSKQAERRENEKSEYQRESYQLDLDYLVTVVVRNSLVAVVVRFVRAFDRHAQVFGLFWSKSRELHPDLLQM